MSEKVFIVTLDIFDGIENTDYLLDPCSTADKCLEVIEEHLMNSFFKDNIFSFSEKSREYKSRQDGGTVEIVLIKSQNNRKYELTYNYDEHDIR